MNDTQLTQTLLTLGGILLGAVIAHVAHALRKDKGDNHREKLAQEIGYSMGMSDGLTQGYRNSEAGHQKNGYMAATQDVQAILEGMKGQFTVNGLLQGMTSQRNQRRATGFWGTVQTRKTDA